MKTNKKSIKKRTISDKKAQKSGQDAALIREALSMKKALEAELPPPPPAIRPKDYLGAAKLITRVLVQRQRDQISDSKARTLIKGATSLCYVRSFDDLTEIKARLTKIEENQKLERESE